MFSAFASTTDTNPPDDDSDMFDQSHNDFLSLPMSHESIHMKGGIAPMSGLSHIDYGRESATSSVHYGDSNDTLEINHQSGRDEREDSTPGAFTSTYGLNLTPSPLPYPNTPYSTVENGAHSINGTNSNRNDNAIFKPVDDNVSHQRDGVSN